MFTAYHRTSLLRQKWSEIFLKYMKSPVGYYKQYTVVLDIFKGTMNKSFKHFYGVWQKMTIMCLRQPFIKNKGGLNPNIVRRKTIFDSKDNLIIWIYRTANNILCSSWTNYKFIQSVFELILISYVYWKLF